MPIRCSTIRGIHFYIMLRCYFRHVQSLVFYRGSASFPSEWLGSARSLRPWKSGCLLPRLAVARVLPEASGATVHELAKPSAGTTPEYGGSCSGHAGPGVLSSLEGLPESCTGRGPLSECNIHGEDYAEPRQSCSAPRLWRIPQVFAGHDVGPSHEPRRGSMSQGFRCGLAPGVARAEVSHRGHFPGSCLSLLAASRGEPVLRHQLYLSVKEFLRRSTQAAGPLEGKPFVTRLPTEPAEMPAAWTLNKSFAPPRVDTLLHYSPLPTVPMRTSSRHLKDDKRDVIQMLFAKLHAAMPHAQPSSCQA